MTYHLLMMALFCDLEAVTLSIFHLFLVAALMGQFIVVFKSLNSRRR